MHEVIAKVLSLIRGLWRYRWPAVGLAWLACVGGWIYVYMMPNRFEASARVYVDTQSILKPLMQGLAVQPNLDQQISMMSRTLITRPNLEKVLRMADLDIKVRSTAEKEGLIDVLARRIEIKGTGKDNLYSLTYWDSDSAQAKKVVQSLLTIFVEGSLGDKRKDADGARRFLDEQIKVYEQKLIVAENALKEFKQKNMGLMPNERQDYYGRLGESSERLKQARLELREAENARDAIRAQIAGEEPVLLPEQEDIAVGEGGGRKDFRDVNPELQGRIEALEKNLDQLRLKYTEKHPDIVGTKRILQQLEEQKAKEMQELQAQGEIDQAKRAEEAKASGGLALDRGQRKNANPVFQQLKVQVSTAEAAVASIKARVAEHEEAYKELKAMANMVPQVEAEMSQLNRDYEVNKANYEKLLARRESAQISGEMEQTNEGLDFRIIDPPRVPLQPTGPNRPLLYTVVLLVGVLVAFGFALIMSQVRPTFHDKQGLREFTGLPLLGSVSMIWTPDQRRKAMRGRFAYTLGCIGLLCAYGAIMGITMLKSDDMLGKLRGLVGLL
jgi:polysaccharide chain length determinant protein (PEP-CTERM system associated)